MKTVFKTGRAKVNGDEFSITHEEGEYIFREGDLGTEMYIIQEGEVEILKTVDGEVNELAVFAKGDFFGEMSVLEDLPRTASARAKIDTRLIQINGSTFDQMLRGNPEIAVRMMRKLARRLREMDELLEKEHGIDSSTMTGRAHEAAPPSSGAIKSIGLEYLIHEESGERFHLATGPETTVGREDPVTGINPHVDLTQIDQQRSTSRRHAKVLRKDDGFYVTEEIGTTNGTFLNGERAETGSPLKMKTGDTVQFGLVKLVFHDDG